MTLSLLPCQAATFQAGPLIHDSDLTLESGSRREAAGPFYYEQFTEGRQTYAVPPLFSWVHDPRLDFSEFDLLYPVLTHDRFGTESRVQLFQLLSLSHSGDQDANVRDKFTLFPIYFHQRSTNSTKNYTALFPLHGTLRNRLFRDEIRFTLFPLYSRTLRKDVTTRNYLYPFFHLREGTSLRGWQLWPLIGDEVRRAHVTTNRFGDEVTVPGQRISFFAWPFFLRKQDGIGGTNELRETSVLPLFSVTRSPARDATSILWPFFRYTNDREKDFREWGFPWPLWGVARGAGKHLDRVWPLYSVAYNPNVRSEWYLWPLWKRNTADVEGLYRRRTRLMFFLYNDLVERNKNTREEMRRRDLWPLFHQRRQLDGRERLQILALLEPLLPNNKSIERNWSPVWSLWRTEKNPETRRRSDSLLWNLWRREITDGERHNSYFFGLLSNRKTADGSRWSWFDPVQVSDDGAADEDGSNTVAAGVPRPEIGVVPLRPLPFAPETVDR